MDWSIGKRARLWAVALAVGGWCTGPALAESRLALVIGNSNYETVTVLPNPANDAKAMSELLIAAGFQIINAPDLGASEMRRTLREFAGAVAQQGPDTVALVYYAGHGLQVDGENFLVPIDARITREADVPMEAVRLADVMNALASAPSRTRIVILDACRNNPFAEIKATTGRGLAIVDAPTGSMVSYATSPGMEALDGDAANSPFTAALVEVAREPGLPIEQALKRVRLKVHMATNGQQTPWESSSLTADFAFFGGAGALVASADPRPTTRQIDVIPARGSAGDARPSPLGQARAQSSKTVQDWTTELQRLPSQEAYEVAIREDSVEAYDAFLALYGAVTETSAMRSLLDRRREMLAWQTAVTLNTPAGYRDFLDRFPRSDLAATARKLMDRARTRSAFANANALAAPVTDAPPPAPPAPPPERVAALPAPACTCQDAPRAAPPPTRVFVPPPPPKRKEPPPKKQVKRHDPAPPPTRRGGRAPTDADIFGPGRGPAAATPRIPVSIGIGFGGGRRGGGGHHHQPRYTPSHSGGHHR